MVRTEIKQVELTSTLPERRKVRRELMTPLACSILASFGIFGGIASLFIGIVFVVLHNVAPAHAIFDRVGTGLLIVAIPMILMGSIFLDEIDASNKKK